MKIKNSKRQREQGVGEEKEKNQLLRMRGQNLFKSTTGFNISLLLLLHSFTQRRRKEEKSQVSQRKGILFLFLLYFSCHSLLHPHPLLLYSWYSITFKCDSFLNRLLNRLLFVFFPLCLLLTLLILSFHLHLLHWKLNNSIKDRRRIYTLGIQGIEDQEANPDPSSFFLRLLCQDDNRSLSIDFFRQ